MKIFGLNALAVLVAFLILMNGNEPLNYGYIPETITLHEPTQFELWAEAISEFESEGDPTVVNAHGMMGKYQFSPETVRGLGFAETPEEFLMRPHLQDEVFIAYYNANRRELRSLINRFNGKTVNGLKLTPAAILAGAHFAGARGVRRYLEQNIQTVDSNGTNLTAYMTKFADYKLEVDE